MKQFLMLLIAVAFSSQSFAESDVRKVYRLSGELADLQTQMAIAQKDQKSRLIKVIVSTTAAVGLGLISKNMLQAKGGDITGPLSFVLGAAGSAVTLGVLGYDGYQMYQLSLQMRAIPELQKSIAAKQAELKLIMQANEQSEDALKELNN